MFKKNPIEEKLDAEITNVLAQMDRFTTKDAKEYATMVDQFEKLMKLRNESRLSKDALATIAANAIGLIVVMNHERAHVIATKAFTLVRKMF